MNATTLVVDDDRSVRYSLTRLFEGRGLEVETARSGEEALDKLQHLDVDVVLMDIKMSGMSGLEALPRMKDLAPRVPVILMTAYGTTESAIEAMKSGAFDYVLKPFDIPKMCKIVERALLEFLQNLHVARILAQFRHYWVNSSEPGFGPARIDSLTEILNRGIVISLDGSYLCANVLNRFSLVKRLQIAAYGKSLVKRFEPWIGEVFFQCRRSDQHGPSPWLAVTNQVRHHTDFIE